MYHAYDYVTNSHILHVGPLVVSSLLPACLECLHLTQY